MINWIKNNLNEYNIAALEAKGNLSEQDADSLERMKKYRKVLSKE